MMTKDMEKAAVAAMERDGDGVADAGKIGIPDLLPCPFCGGDATVREPYSGVHGFIAACWNQDCPVHACATGATLAEAAGYWNLRAERAKGTEGELVTTIRWTRVEEALPHYGHMVAVWSQTLGLVLRAWRDGRAAGAWCGEDERRISDALVTAWAPLPNGVLPAPDGGAA